MGRELTQRLLPPGRAPLLPGVRPGLVEGSFVDLSDAQWRSFREALPLLCVVAAASSAAARLVRGSLRAAVRVSANAHTAAAQAHALRPGADVAFHAAFGLAYVGAHAD